MEKRSERLKHFLKVCYDKNAMKLAKKLEEIIGRELSRQNMSHYMNTEKPSTQLVNWLFDAGMNSNYYLYGIGDMFAENEIGRLLRKKYASPDTVENAEEMMSEGGFSDKDIQKIMRDWIVYNFSSVSNFALAQGEDFDLINHYMNGEKELDDTFIIIMRTAGFNFAGLFYEGQSLYLDSPEGQALKARHESRGKTAMGSPSFTAVADIRSTYNKDFLQQVIEEVLQRGESEPRRQYGTPSKYYKRR